MFLHTWHAVGENGPVLVTDTDKEKKQRKKIEREVLRWVDTDIRRVEKGHFHPVCALDDLAAHNCRKEDYAGLVILGLKVQNILLQGGR